MEFTGRKKITSDQEIVTAENVLAVLNRARAEHDANRVQIEYLWNYWRGRQPVLERTKRVREDICNRIVVNHANEIVSFGTGYLCGEPIQYVAREGSETVAEGISRLNEMMFSENKAALDREIVEWGMICGTAYRMVLPDPKDGEPDDAPFELYTLDPRNTFVVYRNAPGNRPLMAVTYAEDENLHTTYSVYTPQSYFEIRDGKINAVRPNPLGRVPILEYPANNARLGAFEVALPLLNAINAVASNRLDGVEQFVQSFLKFVNCDVDENDVAALREMLAIKVKSVDGMQADVSLVSQELDQQQTQTLADSLYQTVLVICGMPNRNGGSSTSDTGSAVLLRDGWSAAEARAKDRELMFKQSEQEFLKTVLHICRNVRGMNLRLRDIDMKFTRRNYEAIQSKSQVLCSMLQQPHIHPLLAFTCCGMFSDPEEAYKMSKAYYEEQQQKQEETGHEGNGNGNQNTGEGNPDAGGGKPAGSKPGSKPLGTGKNSAGGTAPKSQNRSR